MGKKLVLKTNIKRLKDKFYVCSTSEGGYVTILECDRKNSGRKKKLKVVKSFEDETKKDEEELNEEIFEEEDEDDDEESEEEIEKEKEQAKDFISKNNFNIDFD